MLSSMIDYYVRVASYLRGCLIRIPNPSSSLVRRSPVVARIVSLKPASNTSADLFRIEVSPFSGGPNIEVPLSDIIDEVSETPKIISLWVGSHLMNRISMR